MPQHHPAVNDETARLDGGPVPGPPPGVPGGHAQSARHGRPVDVPAPSAAASPADLTPADATRADVVPAAESPAAGFPAEDREPDDTRPVSREWMTAGSPPSTTEAPGPTRTIDDGHPDVPAEPPAGDGAPAGSASGDEPAGERHPRRAWWRRAAFFAPAAAVVVLGAAYGVDLLITSGDIPRHTVVAGIDIGGLSPAAASQKLERELAPRVTADHTVVAGDVRATLSPATAGITLDVHATVDAAAVQPYDPWTRITTFFSDRPVDPVITEEATALDAQLEAIAGQVDQLPVEATVALDGTTPSVVQPVDGRTLDRDGAAAAITRALAAGGDPTTPIELPVTVVHPHVGPDEAQRVLDGTVKPALSAPVTLVSQDGGTSTKIPVAAIAAVLTFTPQDDGTLAVAIDPAALQSALGRELGVFGAPATDASFRVNGDTISVVPSVDGTGVDPAKLAGQLLPVLTGPAPRTVTVELGPVPATFTTQQAQSLGITEQVGSFTTHFTNSASGTNIRVVAAKVNGALVRPGETFSLNTFTGPRGTAQGYVPAAVISGGELSQAVGGGISQFATTMFNAVFFAGLQDVHHKPHSFYISRYPAGREATVYEGLIDLVWKNDSNTGIYVQTRWEPGTLTVTLWGTRHYDIESVSGDRRNVTDPVVQDKVDDGNCTPQSGTQGFDITVTRVFHDLTSGAVLRTDDFHTHYAAEAVIHCVPPVQPPASPPPGGTTPSTGPTGGGRRPGPRRRR
jgi:vancomycin resistance protein YoaR